MSEKKLIGPAAEHIERLWGDVPVVDAKNDLRVIVQPCDVELATAKDPGCCVFAQACKRAFGATKVLFFRSVAYVELPTEEGERQVERFYLSNAMCELIKTFDKGNPVLPEGGFLLKAPTPSKTLGSKWRQQKKHKNALLKGTAKSRRVGSVAGAKFGKYSPKHEIDLEVRLGSGRVQFINAARE